MKDYIERLVDENVEVIRRDTVIAKDGVPVDFILYRQRNGAPGYVVQSEPRTDDEYSCGDGWQEQPFVPLEHVIRCYEEAMERTKAGPETVEGEPWKVY